MRSAEESFFFVLEGSSLFRRVVLSGPLGCDGPPIISSAVGLASPSGRGRSNASLEANSFTTTTGGRSSWLLSTRRGHGRISSCGPIPVYDHTGGFSPSPLLAAAVDEWGGEGRRRENGSGRLYKRWGWRGWWWWSVSFGRESSSSSAGKGGWHLPGPPPPPIASPSSSFHVEGEGSGDGGGRGVGMVPTDG